MTRRQNNNQWSGGIAAHPPPPTKKIQVQKSAGNAAATEGRFEEKRREKFTKGGLFLHDNVPLHRALATQKELTCLGFQCLHHPPCSPDLAPSDYHLFPGLKKTIFRPTQRSLLPRRPGWTDNLLNLILSGLQKLEQQAKKCIELRGEYVE